MQNQSVARTLYVSANEYGLIRTLSNLIFTSILTICLLSISIYLLNSKGNHTEEIYGRVAEDSKCHSSQDGKFTCLTKYIYKVDGKYFAGMHTSAHAFAKKKRVKVLYCADDPEDSVLYTGNRTFGAYAGIVVAVIIFITSLTNYLLARINDFAAFAQGIAGGTTIVKDSMRTNIYE